MMPSNHPYYYKFTATDGKAPYGLGKISKGEWMPSVQKLVPCLSGYHVLCPESLIHWINKELYRVEVRGDYIWKNGGFVLVVESYRTHSRVEQWSEKNCRLLGAYFAQWAVDRYWAYALTIDRDMSDIEDTRPQNAINAAKAYAHGEITIDELAAAQEAAWAAAKAAGPWRIAGRAARAAAEAAATQKAAWGAARAAAWKVGPTAQSDLNKILIDFMIAHTD